MWRQQQQNRKKPNSAISNQIYKIKSHSELLFSCFCNEHTASDLTPNSKTVRQAVPTICHNSHSCSYTIFLACAAGCSGASRLFTSANRRIKPGSTADTRTRRKCIRAAASAGGPSCCFTGRMEDILEVRRENGSVNHQRPHEAWPGETSEPPQEETHKAWLLLAVSRAAAAVWGSTSLSNPFKTQQNHHSMFLILVMKWLLSSSVGKKWEAASIQFCLKSRINSFESLTGGGLMIDGCLLSHYIVSNVSPQI